MQQGFFYKVEQIKLEGSQMYKPDTTAKWLPSPTTI